MIIIFYFFQYSISFLNNETCNFNVCPVTDLKLSYNQVTPNLNVFSDFRNQ